MAARDPLQARAKALHLHGPLAHWSEAVAAGWAASLLAWEEEERARRSLGAGSAALISAASNRCLTATNTQPAGQSEGPRRQIARDGICISGYHLRAHLAIVIPASGACGLTVGGETRSWSEGKCLLFDASTEHSVWNDGPGDRVVFVVDLRNPTLH